MQKSLSLIPLAAAASTGVVSLSSPAVDKPQGVLSDYVPAYFNDKEWKFLLAALDRLIPADANGPGAVSEGVPVFIDKQMEFPYGYGRLCTCKAPSLTPHRKWVINPILSRVTPIAWALP
ncbi:gluconate 2-dehydrogenase subunit 3 family protein [Pantoea rodasii]|uniref:gluconate 2-dehydrogenase subunit 3 family protein n=1 Tax=Pantoea rodasii TaxID=1076549 RepID=UPI0034553FD5